MAKRAKESSRTGSPAAIISPPKMRNEENPKSGGAMRQRVKVQGTYTARVPGAITRKIAEPSRAMARFMSSPHSILERRLENEKSRGVMKKAKVSKRISA